MSIDVNYPLPEYDQCGFSFFWTSSLCGEIVLAGIRPAQVEAPAYMSLGGTPENSALDRGKQRPLSLFFLMSAVLFAIFLSFGFSQLIVWLFNSL